ncbi:MAG TPA: DUF192 domain-containing protein [Candidatus Limnocylindrales bacterium]|nr:DUF192 domain-containing protein [Candidatus Limnocylindrales bacterium]
MAIVVLLADVVAFWVVPRFDIPPEFWGSEIETVDVDARELRLVRVDYQDGLRNVASLGGLDGALFVLPRTMTTGHGMGMDRVLMPLDVVFFDAAGRFVDRHTMDLCEPGACPGYYPGGEWQFAIEAPAGALSWIGEGSVLRR